MKSDAVDHASRTLHLLAMGCAFGSCFMASVGKTQVVDAPFGGLRQQSRDVHRLEFTKIAIASTSSSGGSGSADATADFSLSDQSLSGSVSNLSPGGQVFSTLSATGFTTDGTTSLGTGVITSSAEASAATPAESTLATYSAYTQFSLVRSATSSSSAFVNSFANLFR